MNILFSVLVVLISHCAEIVHAEDFCEDGYLVHQHVCIPANYSLIKRPEETTKISVSKNE